MSYSEIFRLTKSAKELDVLMMQERQARESAHPLQSYAKTSHEIWKTTENEQIISLGKTAQEDIDGNSDALRIKGIIVRQYCWDWLAQAVHKISVQKFVETALVFGKIFSDMQAKSCLFVDGDKVKLQLNRGAIAVCGAISPLLQLNLRNFLKKSQPNKKMTISLIKTKTQEIMDLLRIALGDENAEKLVVRERTTLQLRPREKLLNDFLCDKSLLNVNFQKYSLKLLDPELPKLTKERLNHLDLKNPND